MNEVMTKMSVNENPVTEIFGSTIHVPGRLLYPYEGVDEKVLTTFQKFRALGRRIVLVDGAFDVPHPSHELYLRHCKILGAEAVVRSGRVSRVADALKDNSVALAVTVDADEKIAQKKSNNPDKGGIERPVYPWEARANRIAGYAYEIDDVVHFTADLVTTEGDSLHKGTLLESSLHLAHGLKKYGLLDDLVLYGEHPETIKEARRIDVNPLVIDDGIIYNINPQTDEDWHSSDIIRRAQGGAVAKHPITRPEPGRYE